MMDHMDQPGTLRPIPDPQAEMDRLARLRDDPPGRVWGVKHADGRITVKVTGHPFSSCYEAERERAAFDAAGAACEECDGGTHTLVCRDTAPWREAGGA